MSVSAIDSTTTVAGAGATGTEAAATSTKMLGQDAFLKLLIAELQNQDPTKPMDNSEFITQLATMNSVEKLNSIDSGIKDVNTAIKALNDLIAGNIASEAAGGQI